MTVNRRLAKSHGYYLQHAKEVTSLMSEVSLDGHHNNVVVKGHSMC